MCAASAIFTFHSLDSSGSVISYEPRAFAALLEGLAEEGIPVVPLDEVSRRAGAVALTFDDAFVNFFEAALPLLERHRMPATVFAVSGHCGGKNDWPTQSKGIPILPLMSWSQLREAARRGVAIGSHTVSHPYLTGLGPSQIAAEVRQSRDRIEQEISAPVTAFAYPYGAAPAGVATELEAAGYRCAVTTELAYTGQGAARFALPRLDSYYLRNTELARRPFSGKCRGYVALRGLLRRVRGAARLPSSECAVRVW